jgi:hypothetical protein
LVFANFTAPSRFSPSSAYHATPGDQDARSDSRPIRAHPFLDQPVDLGQGGDLARL